MIFAGLEGERHRFRFRGVIILDRDFLECEPRVPGGEERTHVPAYSVDGEEVAQGVGRRWPGPRRKLV